MNYIFLSDILWYSGHILSGCSILYSHNNYTIAILFVFFGQFITIISRPISRFKNNNENNKDIDENNKNINENNTFKI